VRRVVLDTNIFLDCWVFDDPAARALKAALETGRVLAARSAATDNELADVLARPRFGLAPAAIAALMNDWTLRASLHAVDLVCPIRCADPDDQKFLDLALAARAHALFTKDKALLATAAGARALDLHVALPDAARSVLFLEDDLP
jgi:putative PIN family toxin of toxin-antitoxin system